MKNYFKIKRPKPKSIFSIIENFLDKTSLSKGLPIKYLPHLFFVFVLGLIYVANTHYHQKILRKIAVLEEKVTDLRVSYITLKSSYMYSLKQSGILNKVKELNLEESKNPPMIIP